MISCLAPKIIILKGSKLFRFAITLTQSAKYYFVWLKQETPKWHTLGLLWQQIIKTKYS